MTDQGSKITLYKYQPLIELKTDGEEKEWQRRLDNALKQQVWLHPLAALNDPFERHFKYISDPDKATQDGRIFQHLHDFYTKDSGVIISPDEFAEILKTPKFRERVSTVSNSWVNGVFLRHGTLCLTRDPSNIPMWAHYANNHRGYCIVFELDMSFFAEATKAPDTQKYIQDVLEGKEILTFHLPPIGTMLTFTKVHYSNTPPIMHLEECLDLLDTTYEGIEYFITHAIGVKYKQWEYENEYRLIANKNSKESGLLNLSLMPFLRVTGTILGSQLTTDEKNIIDEQCRKNKSRLYQAKCSDTDYKITNDLIHDYSSPGFLTWQA